MHQMQPGSSSAARCTAWSSPTRTVGRELRVGLPVTTLSWLRAEDPPEEGLIPASLPDFVLSQLCGTEPTTEATNAAAHGLFHLERGDWHHELIGKLGLSHL